MRNRNENKTNAREIEKGKWEIQENHHIFQSTRKFAKLL